MTVAELAVYKTSEAVHEHTEEIIPGKAATCTETGLTEGVKCSVCGEILVEQEELPALGHTAGEAVVENKVAATCTEDGSYDSVVYCSVCKEEISRETVVVPATGHDWQDGTCGNCGAVQPGENPFVDVPEGSYYYDAVQWAVENGIAYGVSDNHFDPDTYCNRADVVTFLWRAANKPEPETAVNPFTDVNEGDYFYKAVLWGVENGIVAGISANKFGPYMLCTREQVVTFLWRAADRPDSAAEVTFNDVQPGAYYATAVAWAVENGITYGFNSTKFGVNYNCTRAQVVTFLYRVEA